MRPPPPIPDNEMCLSTFIYFTNFYLTQIRHPDVSANAIGVFFGLGVALFLETFSIYYSGPGFWALFCFVNISIKSKLNLYIHLSGLHHCYNCRLCPRLQHRDSEIRLQNSVGGDQDPRQGSEALVCQVRQC